MRSFDPSLYLVTDPGLVPPAGLVEAVGVAIANGVTIVQLRDKDAEGRALAETARALLAVMRPLGVPLIINDRADVMVAVGADGVHIGQSDLSVDDVRRVVGPTAIVGLSVEAVEHAHPTQAEGASYVAVSPVYGTPTKTDTAPPLGLEGVERVAAAAAVPVVGIGGIDATRAPGVIDAGANGVAVVSAILAAPDIGAAARTLRDGIRRAKEERRA